MEYSIRQLAKQSGVTGRTLRYYDSIGLLRPVRADRNGQRFYDDAARLRLQQILFYRELEFPLEDIRAMIDHPKFDLVESLRGQRRMLAERRAGMNKLIASIDATITHMQNQTQPSDDDLYGGFTPEEQAKLKDYEKEAEQKWGGTDAWKQSRERAKAFTKDDWAAMKEETDANLRALVALMVAGKAPESDEVQAEVARHRAGINRFYDCTDDIYRGLAEMYLADQRFADFYRTYHADLPEFLSRAMKASCK